MAETLEAPELHSDRNAAARGLSRSDAFTIPKHIPALDGLRGIAVLLVLLHHFGLGGDIDYPSSVGKVFFGASSRGWMGVDLFFVLSGFLITGILLDSKSSKHYFRTFYARRILRIFPLYYGVLFACWIVLPLPFGKPVAQPTGQWWLWCYATSIYPMIAGKWFDATSPLGLDFGHFWSLAVEEHFYLVWPFIAFYFSRRWLTVTCFLFLIAAPVLRGLIVMHGKDPSDWPYYMTPCRVDSLAAGALLAIAMRAGWARRSYQQLAFVLLGMGTFGLATMFACNRLERTAPSAAILMYSLVAVLASGVLLQSVLLSLESLFGRVLARGVLPFFGKYSYGIYVFHGLLFLLLLRGPLSVPVLNLVTKHYLVSVIVHFIAGSAISVGLAWMSWHLYEKHFLKLKRLFEYKPVDNRG